MKEVVYFDDFLSLGDIDLICEPYRGADYVEVSVSIDLPVFKSGIGLFKKRVKDGKCKLRVSVELEEKK